MNSHPLINDFLTRRFKELKQISKNIGGKEHEDLFSHTIETLYISPKARELAEKGEIHLYRWTLATMKSTFRLPTSDFRRWKKEELMEAWEEGALTQSEEADFDFETTPYEKELSQMGFTDQQKQKIISTRKIWQTLTPTMKCLFHNYFIRGYSIREIARLNSLPPTTIFRMLQQLKSLFK